MNRISTSVLLVLLWASHRALSAEIACPQPPAPVTTITRDVTSDIAAGIGALGKVKAGELSVRTQVTAKNLFDKYPNLDRIVALQVMSSTYCVLLQRANIPDIERLNRWEVFQSGVLNINVKGPTESPGAKPVASGARVTDVVVEQLDARSAILDIRVLNEGKVDLQVSRVILVPLDWNYEICPKGPASYSYVYAGLNLDDVRKGGAESNTVIVSQVIPPGKGDRFGVKAFTQSNCQGQSWKLRVYLQTSVGRIGGSEVNIKLP